MANTDLVERFTDPLFKGLERLTDSWAPHVVEENGVTKRRYKLPDDMMKEDINIKYNKGVLTVKAHHEQKDENMYFAKEMTYRELIGQINPESMHSSFRNNVLTIEYTTPGSDTDIKIDVS